jgi:hypothetical protein
MNICFTEKRNKLLLGRRGTSCFWGEKDQTASWDQGTSASRRKATTFFSEGKEHLLHGGKKQAASSEERKMILQGRKGTSCTVRTMKPGTTENTCFH